MASADPLDVTRPSFPCLSASATLTGHRPRTQTSPKRAAAKDEKPRKVSPLLSRPFSTKTSASAAKPTTTKWIPRTFARRTSTASKPLVPLSERRSREKIRVMTGRIETGIDNAEVVPDGSSAGRKGRQFTVANVGNNGRIYLRPSVRPAHQRYPQPNFTFPITPPSTAIVDSWSQSNRANLVDANTKKRGEDEGSSQETPWTPTTSATPLAAGDRQLTMGAETSSRPIRHRRAVSDSTVHEASANRDQDSHVFKVAISTAQGRDEQRPRTMDDLNAIANGPMLNVNIPSWRLGTPRFTLRGTPILRGSSYAPTEDARSSTISGLNSSPLPPNSTVHGLSARRPDALAVPTSRTHYVAQRGAPGLPSPRLLRPLRSTHMSTQMVIEPAMFTELTFKPSCDDGLIVRYSAAGAVTAATPPRLVAEITSPSFLDYELISDFFLTFRSFLEPSDLLRMLVARLRWALDRDDEVGMIVRVRTFVALRHWILNYFVDDFLLEHSLRVTFCNLLNDFVDELSQDFHSRRVQIRILAELKKCWRRVCAQYWDGDEFDDSLGPDIAVTPGGVAGSRDPDLDPTTAPETLPIEPDQHDAVAMPSPSPSHQAQHATLRNEIPNPIPVGDFVVLDNRPGTPEYRTGGPWNPEQSPTSPYSLASMASMDIVSCSFPGKNMKSSNQNTAHLLAAHPVPSSAVGNATGPIATTPKALVGKRVRPTQAHKRNNSLSDSLREYHSDRASSTDQDSLPAPSSGGRLVRGNLLPPGQAFVNVQPSGRHGHANRQTTVFQPKSRDFTKDGMLGGATSGHGMRKLLRSVRKALKNRGQGLYPTQQAFTDIQFAGPRGATVNRLPGTAVVPQGTTIRQNGSRPPVRIDLLGAEVAEDFKKAIREEEEEAVTAAAAAAAAAGDGTHGQQFGGVSIPPPSKSAPLLSTFPENSASRMDSTTLEALTQHHRQRPFSDMAITVGSKSIVIVDDTVPFEMPSVHETHGVGIPSVDTFCDSFVRGGADPTPPNTPPSHSFDGGKPRRSSYLLNQHVIGANMVEDVLPPFIPDLASLESSQSLRTSEYHTQPSMSAIRPGGEGRLSSRGAPRSPRRALSWRSQQSLNSMLHRRDTSLGSVGIPPTLRSLGATTDSGGLYTDPSTQVAIPEPLRVLRRRPGGDLKAVINAGDLDRVLLRRSQSVGSLATYTESIRNSYMLSSRPNSAGEFVAAIESRDQGRADVFSLGQLAEKPKKRNLSLFSTHSSKPIMRPSFEAEAQKLAQIPDDDDDGIESALLKLEGKFLPKKPINLSMIGQNPRPMEDTAVEAEQNAEHPPITEQSTGADPDKTPKLGNVDRLLSMHPALDEASPTFLGATDGQVRDAQHLSRTGLSSFLSEGSHDSYCSIPLLQRGLGDETTEPVTHAWTGRSILRGSDDEESLSEPGLEQFQNISSGDPYSSFELVQKTASMEKVEVGETVFPIASVMEDASFLKDDSADSSDLSSGLSDDDGGGDDDDTFSQREGEIRAGHVSDLGLPTHPLSDEPTAMGSRPSSPQITLVQALAMSPDGFVAPGKSDARPKKPLPLTPELTPVVGCSGSPRSTAEISRHGEPLSNAAQPNTNTATTPKHSVHLPFILAFDSDVLAQQFTLIEKDALTEIDWRELIDMSWKHFACSNSRSWVDFLRNIDAQGVDVVIARFNIMVKWAISEIVLTQQVEERARCIIKLIHIAAHCRRYRNFATLAQLTIALSSNEVSRLSKTWQLVPERDLRTLHDLEILVTPSRNFHNIREEMEVGTDRGCIPFVGIYTHDLLYNAQRPSEIAASPTNAPLVNFEKCRCGAAVVKTLLRLLEASTRYTFQPIEGVTERCLWIGALSDDEIRKYSQNIE
uniref:LteA n=1 Tax=Epichloe gansuensis TaxID=447254 RepID=G8EB21_9HYPO|nr:LteA [Epichloe gansuensis]